MNKWTDAAIQHLSAQRCSEEEMRDFLGNLFEAEDKIQKHINATLTYLKNAQLIDDRVLALHLATPIVHKGNSFIRELLKQRGLSDEIIADTLSALPDEHFRALEEASKKIQLMSTETKEVSKNLLLRFLNGRRFAHTTIEKVLEKLVIKKSGDFKVIHNPFYIQKAG